ncbi:hypothetical protein F5B17DRAFT_184780 [Nemania serpens]|nr:hypothetical protein F5B17DRAFT_184780 [Nemania serpens]
MLFSTNSLTWSHIYPHSICEVGDVTTGMAAKARGITQTNSCLVKRNARLRQRAVLRTSLIPTQITEGSGLRRNSMFSSHTYRTVFSKAVPPVEFLPCPETLRPCEMDTDAKTTVSANNTADSDDPWFKIPKSSPRSTCYLADLSNYLGAPHSDNDADTVMPQPDPDPPGRESLYSTDSYGWEIGYGRRLDCGNANTVRGRRRLGYRKR